ncbi:squalene synthetase-like protein [Coemansia erecta]|nr:squalene synthetase-like protein [Coemansia erecta]KAJ2878089.1 squalene synthetase-like protein [Coemansia asiatica]
MDQNLFFIDTKGSSELEVTTATSSRQIRVVGPRADHKSAKKKENKGDSQQFQIITDDIAVTSAHTLTHESGSNSRDKNICKHNKMNGLNEQFLDLDVGKGRGKGKGRNQRKKNWEANKKKEASRGYYNNGGQQSSKNVSPGFDYEDYADDALDDYIDNLDEKELAQLLEGSVENANGCGYGYATRDIGGNSDSDTMLSDQIDDIDDPLDYNEKILQMMLGSSEAGFDNGDSSDDEYDEDGIPVSLDLEALSGPGKRTLPKSKNKGHGHRQSGQNIKDFKALDRAKSRNSHATQKNKSKAHDGRGPSAGFDPRTVIRRLDMLLKSEDLDSIWLQPMNKYERQIVHILAREYNIKSKSHGNGDRRTPVLTLTPRSHRPDNRRRINRLLLLFDEGGLVPDLWSGPQASSRDGSGFARSGKGKQGSKGKQKSANGQKGSAQMHGKAVAHSAPAVGDSNVGHKMLKQMGWQPGQGLGANEEGRSTPVEVMFRAGRRGLGA